MNNEKLANALRFAKAMKYGDALDAVFNILDTGAVIKATKANKTKIWMDTARKAHRPGERKPCAVCGGYSGLTESHHLYELHLQRRLGVKNADQTCVWLCPTHHRIIHNINGDNDEAIEKVSATLTESELDKFMELLVMRNKIKRKLIRQVNPNYGI